MTERVETIQEHDDTSNTMKRRGLIAGAAALVAGMVAKQIAEEAPVAANDSTWSFPYTGSTTSSGAAFDVTNTDGDGISGTSTNSRGVQGSSTHYYGVQGSSTHYYGVYGASTGAHAVYGELSGTTAGAAGVFGYGNGTGTFGVLGDGYVGTGIGVQGQSNGVGAVGVKGISGHGYPIIGQVTASNTAAGVLGVGTTGPGVQGQSTSGHGLVGTTDDGNGHAGLIGNATHTGGIGLMGIAPNYGQQTVGHAGEFYGNVKISGGSLLAPVMQASVKHQGDGSYRALPGIVAPEGWIEDFGTGTLAADKAEITLDHDFAALIQGDYHVFLTPNGPQHLHVSQKSATGFSVVAMAWAAAAGGPKPAVGGGTFSYRVVAKRKDITSERLAKVAAPAPVKIPTAFEIPKSPEVKAPNKQP